MISKLQAQFLICPIQIWDLFEGGRLFRAVKDGHLNDEQHLAEMVSLMGQPPRAFLERSINSRKFWDSEGERDPGVTSTYLVYLTDYCRKLDCRNAHS